MLLRQLIERIGLANAVVGVLAGLFVVLIIGAGFDFEPNAMLEVVITAGLTTAVLGIAAALPYIAGRVLDKLGLTSSDK